MKTGDCIKTLTAHDGRVTNVSLWETTLLHEIVDKTKARFGTRKLSVEEGKQYYLE